MADASLLSNLSDHLSLQGYVAVEASEGEADVLMLAPSDLEATTKLMLELNIWRTVGGLAHLLPTGGAEGARSGGRRRAFPRP